MHVVVVGVIENKDDLIFPWNNPYQFTNRESCLLLELELFRNYSDIAHSFITLLLQVQENATSTESVPPVNCMNVELSKETLDTMLDGLGKIRDQLNSVARK